VANFPSVKTDGEHKGGDKRTHTKETFAKRELGDQYEEWNIDRERRNHARAIASREQRCARVKDGVEQDCRREDECEKEEDNHLILKPRNKERGQRGRGDPC